jgi:uncharacterized protein YdeI (YjbR/CyaY-like superfamily)
MVRQTLLERKGKVHSLPADLRKALSTPEVKAAWDDLTPLGRNEFICWVTSAKLDSTRERRIARTREELLQGKRRPCCWPGCPHR